MSEPRPRSDAANLLRRLRWERGWTLGQAAQRAGGISVATLSRWENDQHTRVIAGLLRLLAAYGVLDGDRRP